MVHISFLPACVWGVCTQTCPSALTADQRRETAMQVHNVSRLLNLFLQFGLYHNSAMTDLLQIYYKCIWSKAMLTRTNISDQNFAFVNQKLNGHEQSVLSELPFGDMQSSE